MRVCERGKGWEASRDCESISHKRTSPISYKIHILLSTDGIVRAEKSKPTNKANVYSLSMVIVEVRLPSQRIS